MKNKFYMTILKEENLSTIDIMRDCEIQYSCKKKFWYIYM